jgi:hypothetical protein
MLSNPPESKPKALTRAVMTTIAFLGTNNNLTMPKRRKFQTKAN